MHCMRHLLLLQLLQKCVFVCNFKLKAETSRVVAATSAQLESVHKDVTEMSQIVSALRHDVGTLHKNPGPKQVRVQKLKFLSKL